MFQFESDEIRHDLSTQKGLLVDIARGLRQVQRPPGKAKPERRPSDTLIKAACCELLRRSTMMPGGPRYDETASDVAQRLYPADRDVLDYVGKAASTPATTTGAGWASELMQTSVADFLAGADTPSAFAQLSARCLTVSPNGSVKVPNRIHPLVLAGSWIGEAAPKAVFAVTLTSVTLSPSKLAALSTWSEEVSSMSRPSIEAVVRDALAHDLGGLLDTALLDATAATSVRPAGLFASATSVTASTATPLSEAMLADLGALTAAVSTGAPDASVMFIANGKQGLRLKAAGLGDAIVSGYMTAGNVGAVDTNAIVTMLSGIEFRSSISATVHSSDTPAELAASGATNISAPVTSLFQADLIGLRSVLRASWAKRRTGCTALATAVSW